VTVKSGYVEAIARAGGAPFILPPLERGAALLELLSEADGLLMIGGNDIAAKRYKSRQSPKADLIDPRREAFDFTLLAQALKLGKPVFAICLGCQILNVHYGGTLYQHLPDDLPESKVRHQARSNAAAYRHAVRIENGTLLSRVCGGEAMRVISTHHQGIRDCGRGLVVSARAADGLAEAVEDPRRPFVLGVQWHPEDMAEDPRQRALFRAFVAAAGSPAPKRSKNRCK